VPPLGIFVTSIWVFLSPTFGKIEDQKNPKVGDKNSQGQKILKGARFPQIWVQKNAKVGGNKNKIWDNNSNTWEIFFDPNFWEFLSQLLEVEDNISQKLGTKKPKSRGQKIPKGTAISQILGQ
jgi:hypothetical protein